MAKDREPVEHDSSESDSSEEETDESSSDEEDSSEESDSDTEEAKSQVQASSEEGDESGFKSNSESDGPGVQKPNIGAEKPISEPDDPAKSFIVKLSMKGKGAEVKDAKIHKTEPDTAVKPNQDSKKVPFQRVWSEDDEIAILNGMIEHNRKKKSEPGVDFHDFMKTNLRDDVTKLQLQCKISKLKKKYMNNKSKLEGSTAFSKPHEQMVYELSKDVWGNEECVSGAIANGSKSLGKRVMRSTWGLSTEEGIVASGAEHFEAGKGVEGERQWKKLRVKEIELHLKLLEVRKAQAELFLDAFKSEY